MPNAEETEDGIQALSCGWITASTSYAVERIFNISDDCLRRELATGS